MSEARIVVRAAAGAERTLRLEDYVGPEAAERAELDANAWIKSLRDARIDGVPFRDRFVYRGDSLWWFAEIYLHKRRLVARALRAAAACDAVLAAEAPASLSVDTKDPVVAEVVRAIGAARGVAVRAHTRQARDRLVLRAKAAFHTATATVDRARPPDRSGSRPARVVAFVHTAFWKPHRGGESYLGPVLDAIEEEIPGGLHVVGVGPRTNFRVRRWRDRIGEFSDPSARDLPVTPVEQYSRWSTLAPSREVWRSRRETLRALGGSEDLRARAVVGSLDLWPLVIEELAGIADLQFPWSARAMDEAGAALDALSPRVVVTYAEAGGWGRALVLEARRRRIPCVGVQHGFIYRHWLNYRHEPDEMRPSPGNPADQGFPRPDRTLLFDDFAAAHLRTAGQFPDASIEVTGSPHLERFVAVARQMSEAERTQVREAVHVPGSGHVVLVASKHAQLGRWFAHLVSACTGQPDVMIVVKPHPAEGVAPYLQDAAGATHVRVASDEVDMARLVGIARVLVTVHSTAAIEAMAVGVPALVLGLPTNLSPFVDGGAMAGVHAAHELPSALDRIVRNADARQTLAAARAAFLEKFRIVPAEGAARRAAQTIATMAAT